MKGRDEVIEFLRKKWAKENGYKLRKELFAFMDNKIAVQVRPPLHPSRRLGQAWLTRIARCQFFYEYYETKPDGARQWYRCYGLEVSQRMVYEHFEY